MPRPPPPAEALTITGYLTFSANFVASDTSLRTPSLPGITGTPELFIVFLASDLSPIELIIFAFGPIKENPLSSQILENSAFSARKP